MSEVVWKDLAKNIGDPTKISEEIDAKILAHNEDESAHSQSNEAVYNHRVGEILDHLDRSVTSGKIKGTIMGAEYVVYSIFESLDAYATAGANIGIFAGKLYMISDSTYRNRYVANENDEGRFSKNPYFQTVIKVEQITNQTVYFGVGDLWHNLVSFGFKIVNGTLYAKWVDNSFNEHLSSSIGGVTLTNYNVYKAVYTYGSKIEFYVNDVLVHTATTTLPTDIPDRICQIYIDSTVAAEKFLDALYFLFVQDF